LLQWPESTFSQLERGFKRRDVNVYEYKSYTQWMREDVKGPKKTVLVASVLISFFSVVSGSVLLIILLFAYHEKNVGTPLTILELATIISWVVAILSYTVHDVTNTILSKEYNNYVFEKLDDESMLFR